MQLFKHKYFTNLIQPTGLLTQLWPFLLTINLSTLTLNLNNLLYPLLALLLMGGSRASNGWKGGFQ
jgi:hypothetical protein